MSATWEPPEDFSEAVIFVGTIVKDKATFWEHQHSAPLQMGSMVGLEEGEANSKPEDQDDEDSVSTDAMEKKGMKSGSTSGEKMMMSTTTTKPSKMSDSAFSKANFTETVASTESSATAAGAVFSLSASLIIALMQLLIV